MAEKPTGKNPNNPAEKMRAASSNAIERVRSQIPRHFSHVTKNCLCGSLGVLLKNLGLSEADRSALIEEIKSQGFKVPRK